MTAAKSKIQIGPVALDVFPDDLKYYPIDENIGFIENKDIAAIQKPFIEAILKQEAKNRIESPLMSKAEGGMKVRNLGDFDSPIFELLNERVKTFFMKATGAKTAVVDDCWANVVRDGEYTLPHAHKRATASVVYALDGGDDDGFEREPMNGLLIFADPRLANCCQGKTGFVGTTISPPRALRNYMIIFPAHITHLVTPYTGARPRISIAWNLNAHKVSGELKHDGNIE